MTCLSQLNTFKHCLFCDKIVKDISFRGNELFYQYVYFLCIRILLLYIYLFIQLFIYFICFQPIWEALCLCTYFFLLKYMEIFYRYT